MKTKQLKCLITKDGNIKQNMELDSKDLFSDSGLVK